MDILKVKQNGVWTTIPAIIGPRGIGITSITKTGTNGLTDTYTITFSDNTTTTFTLNNGAVPNLTIGTVTEGATAAATITGTTDAPVLNLVLPNANVPTRVSELENDAGYLTQHQDISGKADKADTVLDTTLSRGRKANTTVGEGSFAFGNDVEASNYFSHAEGYHTIASEAYSYAEGNNTTASGAEAHAEGFKTIASGMAAHAEGGNSQALGSFSHVEGGHGFAPGGNIAYGLASHAEGSSTKANSQSSHAEGSGTIANGNSSHTGGKYNIEDSYNSWSEWMSGTEYSIGDKVKITTIVANETTVKGYICKTANSDAEFIASKWTEDMYMNYARIIGNGTSSARSNAYALGWDGTGHYMGDVYVHANADSTGGNKVLTAADITGKQDTLTFDTTPTTSSTNPVTSGGIKSYVDTAVSNINTMRIHICTAQEYNSETGVPTIQNPDTQTFYLVPGGEGSNLFIEWVYVNSAWERFGSADVDLSNYVQFTDYATDVKAGIAKVNITRGIKLSPDNELMIAEASSADIKAGNTYNKPIVPHYQEYSTFYGLAKAAGDSTQSTSSNAVGTYTDAAKTAIQTMLDVPAKSDIPDTSIYATKADTVLETSLSRGRTGGTTVGTGSFAFGSYVTASAFASHAEGTGSTASGESSHAEGGNNIASGQYSHVEGGHTATGRGNQAIGTASHAEGARNIANGSYSHVEGYYNIGNASYAHIGGKYSVEDSHSSWPEWVASTSYEVGDKVKVTVTENNTTTVTGYKCTTANSDAEFTVANWTVNTSMNYAEIIGNGTANSARSNAYALDWNGNGHFMGDIYVHTNADSSGGTKVATVADIPAVPVTDVQVNGVSVLSNGVANVGLMTGNAQCLTAVEGHLGVVSASSVLVKNGTSGINPIVPKFQHESVFYGLSKAAGVDLASEAVTFGTYPTTSQTAIKNMLGVEEGLRVVRLI